MRAFLVSRRRKVRLGISFVALIAFLLFRRYGESLLTFEQSSEVVTLMGIFLTTNFLVNVIRIPLVSGYRHRQKLSADDKDNFILGINTLTVLIIVAVTGLSIFPVFGFDFVAFLTVLGLFAAGFLWSFKEHVNGFVDGLTMMFSKNFRIGDYIKVNETSKGIIRDIGFRSTKVRTDEGDILYVPNSLIIGGEVINYSKTTQKRVIVAFTLPLSSVSDTNHFEKRLIKNVHKDFEDITDPEKMNLRILNISESNIQLSFEVPISTYTFKAENQIKQCVYTNVIAYSNDDRT